MRFGVNYTPSVGWFHSWLDFSPSDTARDLEAIAELGVDHIRVFPLWPLVQPNRALIRPNALRDVVRTVELAAEFGLDVNVDALQGHLSSFDFVPSWLESWHRRNMFSDPDVVASTAEYVNSLATALSGLPNLLGVTVGNEMNQFAAAPHPTPHTIDGRAADRWVSAMTVAARAGLFASGSGRHGDRLVTLSQYDAAWYDDDQPFGPQHAAEYGDATVTHSWVFNGAAEWFGALGAGSVRHAEYLLQLAAAWNREPDRPNWLQEVGVPTNVVDSGEAVEFLERTITHAADVQELFGITWWCSHDVSRALLDFPEVEYDLGLLDNDGRRKPTGHRFAEMVSEFGGRAAAVAPSTALVLDDIDDEGRTRPDFRADCAPGGRFSRAWVEIADDLGCGPQVALRSRADSAALRARGISSAVEVPDRVRTVSVSVAHPAVPH